MHVRRLGLGHDEQLLATGTCIHRPLTCEDTRSSLPRLLKDTVRASGPWHVKAAIMQGQIDRRSIRSLRFPKLQVAVDFQTATYDDCKRKRANSSNQALACAPIKLSPVRRWPECTRCIVDRCESLQLQKLARCALCAA